ncbi:hypothetical protein [Microbacterium sp. WCS2018Hpa-23]|uniref:hypothetical protein n=1 Tax=Microbacterium sp. WCS2018Hpa-23 TaxID=3073634 RepID=UPI0028832D35|nr:hypothetical protein [Microbacterium sp. WCS2018Hpa-23]
MDAYDRKPPAGLISVTNLSSRVLVPSQIYDEGMEEWGKASGNHIYLVAIGPRVNVVSALKDTDGWRIDTEYYKDGWRPRTVRLPAPAFRSINVSVSDGVLVHLGDDGEERYTAVQLARKALDLARDDSSLQAQSWMKHTIDKFFDYTVVYIGQAYGRDVRKSAVKRLTDGHADLQKALAAVNDHHRNSDIGVVLMDTHVQGRELFGSIGQDGNEELARLAANLMTAPDGPLEDKALLIDAAEAMLIRYIQPKMNEKLREFPLKDRPGLVNPLLAAGITHLGVQIDLTASDVVLHDPIAGTSNSRHRFAVNLSTGERDVAGDSPLAWRM